MKNGLIVQPDGTHYWYLNGALHRVDGPAVIWPDGAQSWWLNGFRHRVDGPAFICANEQLWILNDVYHRDDGPAMIRSDGTEAWYLNGKKVTAEVLDWIERLDLPPWQDWGDVEKTLFKVSF